MSFLILYQDFSILDFIEAQPVLQSDGICLDLKVKFSRLRVCWKIVPIYMKPLTIGKRSKGRRVQTAKGKAQPQQLLMIHSPEPLRVKGIPIVVFPQIIKGRK